MFGLLKKIIGNEDTKTKESEVIDLKVEEKVATKEELDERKEYLSGYDFSAYADIPHTEPKEPKHLFISVDDDELVSETILPSVLADVELIYNQVGGCDFKKDIEVLIIGGKDSPGKAFKFFRKIIEEENAGKKCFDKIYLLLDLSLGFVLKDTNQSLLLDGIDVAIEAKRLFGDRLIFSFMSAHYVESEVKLIQDFNFKHQHHFNSDLKDHFIFKSSSTLETDIYTFLKKR